MYYKQYEVKPIRSSAFGYGANRKLKFSLLINRMAVSTAAGYLNQFLVSKTLVSELIEWGYYTS